jgi:hypothetical protein
MASSKVNINLALVSPWLSMIECSAFKAFTIACMDKEVDPSSPLKCCSLGSFYFKLYRHWTSFATSKISFASRWSLVSQASFDSFSNLFLIIGVCGMFTWFEFSSSSSSLDFDKSKEDQTISTT